MYYNTKYTINSRTGFYYKKIHLISRSHKLTDGDFFYENELTNHFYNQVWILLNRKNEFKSQIKKPNKTRQLKINK